MPGPKKAKKDARETGGVVAAVTKHATAKFTSGNAQDFISDSSNSPDPSPDLPAVAASMTRDSPSDSSMLDAAAPSPTLNPAPRAIPTRVGWRARAGIPDASIPSAPSGLAASPGNLISLMGDSPPSRWSSPRPYGTSHTSHTSYASHATHPTSVSVSPPTGGMDFAAARRPLSYHQGSQGSQGSPHELSLHPGAAPAIRRSSLHSHLAQSRATAAVAAAAAGLPSSNPPLPHQPQAHFYGAPDIDLDLQPRQSGIRPGQRGYHFAFDSLPSSYPAQTPLGADTVVAAGYEGGLDVSLVSRRGLEPLVRLTGLRGGVYGAKILPWMSPGTAAEELFPLVAVIVHGPVLPQSAYPEDDGKDGADEAPLPIEYYQTTVEVFSLKQNRWICTLLEAPRIPLQISITSPVFQPPPPTGTFQIKADSGNIAVSSGTTGECWVYRQMAPTSDDVLPFRCVAKLWTTLQQSPKGAVNGGGDVGLETERVRAASAAVPSGQPARHSPKQPVMSLSGRWLAYCPAVPSSQIALRAVVPVAPHGRAPGLASLTPPQLPPVTTETELPQSESVMNKIMRDATQEIISGARWVGQQGWQALNNYWKGAPGASTPQPARSPPSAGYASRGDAAQFPPTHGAVTTAVSKEPGLVSVVDVTALGGFATVHPIATFAAPLGCSFLSFSPTGLWLFTASTKGDVQTVWDLMRIQYTKASPLQMLAAPGALVGSRVRQIAQFSRMTVARIVDVAWTKPNGERLAMVTERGTVHILDLPSSAFTWPPPRRRANGTATAAAQTTAAGGNGTDAGTGRPASVAVSYASTALSSAFDAARPLLTRPRRSSANMPQSTGATIVDHASHGGKMLAAGISHSLGKTGNAISQLRHTGENRVSLPAGSFAPGAACVVWVTGKRSHALFVLGDGIVRSFASRSRKKTSGQRTLHLSPNTDLRLPSLPDDVLAAAVKRYVEPDEYLDFTEHAESASNTMVLLDNRQRLLPNRLAGCVESSIPQAEIESSAPYQPFHTDRRISLYEFDAITSEPAEPELVAEPEPVAAPELVEPELVAEPKPVAEAVAEPMAKVKAKAKKAHKKTAVAVLKPEIEPVLEPILEPAAEPAVEPAMEPVPFDWGPIWGSEPNQAFEWNTKPEPEPEPEPEHAWELRAETPAREPSPNILDQPFETLLMDAPKPISATLAMKKKKAAKKKKIAAAVIALRTEQEAAEREALAREAAEREAEQEAAREAEREAEREATRQATREATREAEREAAALQAAVRSRGRKRASGGGKAAEAAWAFGQPIASTLVDTGYSSMAEETSFSISFEDTRALPASAMERVLEHDGENEQIVVTTRRRRGGGRAAADDEDDNGFFEDDCEVLDFADQRV